jgi:hypothetical protein
MESVVWAPTYLSEIARIHKSNAPESKGEAISLRAEYDLWTRNAISISIAPAGDNSRQRTPFRLVHGNRRPLAMSRNDQLPVYVEEAPTYKPPSLMQVPVVFAAISASVNGAQEPASRINFKRVSFFLGRAESPWIPFPRTDRGRSGAHCLST